MHESGPTSPEPGPLAILVSGGLDSAILLGEAVRDGATVHPLYVRNGLFWEDVELEHLRRFLDAIEAPALRPLQVLDLPAGDLFPAHWSITGDGVPDDRTPDEAVSVPARNVLLLAKALVWCHLRGIPSLALASLRTNPFPDATPAFLATFQEAVNQAVRGNVQVRQPYGAMTKAEVMRRGRGLPLGLTFSCLRPHSEQQCGACNKCEERRRAFAEAGMVDPTHYQQAAFDQRR